MLSSLTTHISFYYCMWIICSLQDLALRRLIIWRSNCQSSLQWRIWEQQNCKVEFNQPSYWLYFVPNLLAFQQLVTLYLGGFIVRVVSEIKCWILKSVQENRVSRLDLAGDLRLQATKSSTRAKHAISWSVMLAGALQDKIRQLAVLLSRDSVKPWVFWKTWFFTFHSHPSINTLIPTKERELPEKILREKA